MGAFTTIWNFGPISLPWVKLSSTKKFSLQHLLTPSVAPVNEYYLYMNAWWEDGDRMAPRAKLNTFHHLPSLHLLRKEMQAGGWDIKEPLFEAPLPHSGRHWKRTSVKHNSLIRGYTSILTYIHTLGSTHWPQISTCDLLYTTLTSLHVPQGKWFMHHSMLNGSVSPMPWWIAALLPSWELSCNLTQLPD